MLPSIKRAPNTHFMVGSERREYHPEELYPEIPDETVVSALDGAVGDGLRVVPDCEIVLLAKTPAPVDDNRSTLGFYHLNSPRSIYLLPRLLSNDVEDYRADTKARLRAVLEKLKKKPEAFRKAAPRIMGLIQSVDQMSGVGRLSRTIKHEFGHLLHHGYYPGKETTFSEFGVRGYLDLALHRGILEPGMDERTQWRQIGEAIAEDFVHTLKNAYYVNVRAPRDVFDGDAARKGSSIVKEMISKKVEENEPLRITESTTDSSMAEMSDGDPLMLLNHNLERILNGDFDHLIDDFAREPERK